MANITKRFGGQNAGNNTINVSPTLFMGLGGSGKEVLMRLRRLFYSNNRITGLPIHSYFWIDTDPRRQNISGKDYLDDPISNALYLPQTDYLDAQVEPEDINEYFRRRQTYDHIFKWLHPSVESLGSQMLINGAGMVRPCGRLAFFNHYEEIRERLESKIAGISSANNVQAAQNDGYAVAPGVINVFLTASIAGGTGAGMFLDTAFLLKHIAQESQISLDITGILFLPSVFKSVPDLQGKKNKGKLYSNAYAVLMELDYYMSPRVGIQLHQVNTDNVYDQRTFFWDGTPKQIEGANGAPFDTVYLIGGENNSGVRLDTHDYTSAFQMSADAIYLEFCRSEFADYKRSIKSNLKSFMLDETIYSELDPDGKTVYSQFFPDRYASFGLSFIKLDTERKRNAAAFFLGKSMAEFLGSGERNEDSIQQDLERILKLNLLNGQALNRNTILEYLLMDHQNDSGPQALLMTHENDVNREYNEINQEIKDVMDQGVAAGYRQLDMNELKPLREKVRQNGKIPSWTDGATQVQTLLLKAKEGWDRHTAAGAQSLQADGNERRIIDRNTGVLMDAIDKAMESEFFKILSMPGDQGIDYADVFCDGLLRIISHINLNRSAPAGLAFTLESDPLSKNNDLKATEGNLITAGMIRAPLYGNAAVHHYSEQYTAHMEKHTEAVKQYLINKVSGDGEEQVPGDDKKKVPGVRKQVINWLTIRYQNDALEKFQIIQEQIIKKINKLKNSLTQYRSGLRDFGASQDQWYDAYNQDQSDIRYHYINQGNDSRNWYKETITETLRPFHADGAALNWSELLQREIINFFQNTYKINDWSPKSFYIFAHHEADEQVRKRFEDKLNRYCFNRMATFMADADAERAFNRNGSPADHERVLQQICTSADIWCRSG